MESFVEDDLILPVAEEPSFPVPHRRLKRLKKASGASAPAPPPVAQTLVPDPSPPSESSSLATSADIPKSAAATSAADAIDSRPMVADDGLDPLFPKSGEHRGWETEETGKEWEVDEGFESFEHNGGGGGLIEELRREKSAKKRLNLDDAEGNLELKADKKKNKQPKNGSSDLTGSKPKESVREKKRLEKERKAGLNLIHVETQRLLRETRHASFKPVPVVQKPISSVLEKIRLRKMEILKIHNISHLESFTEADCSGGDAAASPSLSEALNVRKDDMATNMVEDLQSPNADSSQSKFAHCVNTNDSEDACVDSPQKNRVHIQPNENAEDVVEENLCLLKPSSSPICGADDVSSGEEDNDKENIDPCPKEFVGMDPYPKEALLKDFLDDEAEEEDDSDHDLMRFTEKEDDGSDEDEVANDLISTGFEEEPVDHEKRNELHRKWLEQQDAADTDNVLQRLKFGQQQKELTVHDEEDNDAEGSEEELPYDLSPKNIVRRNSEKAKEMIAQMFTDDVAYVPSDDEEIEESLARRRLSKQTDTSLISPLEDENSREVFGLIKKLNIAPQPKKRGRQATSNFDMLLLGGNANSSSKSSFLGRTNSLQPSSHKPATFRSFIFGRDDSNSRSGFSSSENTPDADQMDSDQPRKALPSRPKSSQSQSRPTACRTSSEANSSSSSSLFDILRRSSVKFDNQNEHPSRESDLLSETQAAHQFSAFKVGRRISRVEARD